MISKDRQACSSPIPRSVASISPVMLDSSIPSMAFWRNDSRYNSRSSETSQLQTSSTLQVTSFFLCFFGSLYRKRDKDTMWNSLWLLPYFFSFFPKISNLVWLAFGRLWLIVEIKASFFFFLNTIYNYLRFLFLQWWYLYSLSWTTISAWLVQFTFKEYLS